MKKDVKFSTRMASTDREAIKELAKQSGMSMSDYVTACCLGKQVVGHRRPERSAEGAEVHRQKSEPARHPGAHGTSDRDRSGKRMSGVL